MDETPDSPNQEDFERYSEELNSLRAIADTIKSTDEKYLELEENNKLYMRHVHEEAQRQVELRKIAAKKNELRAEIQLGLKSEDAVVKLDQGN